MKNKKKLFELQILSFLSDEKEHKRQEIINTIIKDYNSFTKEELEEKSDKGNYKIYSAVDWAISHLKQNGYTSNPKRGYHKISNDGKIFLQKNNYKNEVNTKNSTNAETKMYIKEQNINEKILSSIINTSDENFDKIIKDLIIHMGYETIEKINTKKNEEITSYIISEDPLGVHSTLIQAEKLNQAMGIKEIRKFEKNIKKNNATNGVLITNSSFTGQATKFAQQSNIRLINGKELSKLMIQYKIGIKTKIQYILDENYFKI